MSVQHPDMGLDKLGQTMDKYILHIFGVKEAV